MDSFQVIGKEGLDVCFVFSICEVPLQACLYLCFMSNSESKLRAAHNNDENSARPALPAPTRLGVHFLSNLG